MNYSRKLAWIGMVLVDQHYRGRGLGNKLFGTLIRKAKCMTTIKLDATPAGKKVYEKFGFREEFQILRMIRRPGQFETKTNIKADFKEIHKNDLTLISKCDENTFGVNRKDLIQYLLNDKVVKGWHCASGNHVSDFVLGRNGNKFVHIGPVVATSSGNAVALISKTIDELKDEMIVLDVVEDKKELIAWLCSVGFKKRRLFTRMYFGEKLPVGNPDDQYLICGPEFG